MKIGILTLPLHTNYGGILQAYALQTVLENMGHNVVVFDTSNEYPLPPLWKLPICFAKRIIMKCLGKQQKVFIERHLNYERSVIAQYMQPFVDNHIHRKVIRNFTELKKKDYEAIVVGSDQVWRAVYFSPMWLHQSIDNAFLAFAENWEIKRLSYAASFGTDKWEYTDEETKRCKQLIGKFDAISVREKGGVDLCREHFNVSALQVLDPTMFLTREDYMALFKERNTPPSNGNLLVYVLDESPELTNLVNDIVTKRHLVPFSVNNPYETDESKPLEKRIKISVESWLRGFYDAELVVTDSFHACVFSIIFRKQFVVVGNKKRGMARIESLLKMFGLEDRLINDSKEFEVLDTINYDAVYEKYELLKKESFHFLQANLQ